MASNRDKNGVVVRTGHTVHLGASTGRVTAVSKGSAMVRWISGVSSTHDCVRLDVVRALGRVKVVPPTQCELDLHAVPRWLMDAHP